MKKRKLKNKILKVTITLAVVAFFIFATALDSQSDIPFIVCTVCITYLGVFAYANREWLRKERGKRSEQ